MQNPPQSPPRLTLEPSQNVRCLVPLSCALGVVNLIFNYTPQHRNYYEGAVKPQQ
jgi:hypothetical protein